ncbi:hypothetical protein TRVL_06319 [Trypanosoma vivax]|nr:hypothetical protein TRVL_06319 [Trypanosoma vivax]
MCFRSRRFAFFCSLGCALVPCQSCACSRVLFVACLLCFHPSLLPVLFCAHCPLHFCFLSSAAPREATLRFTRSAAVRLPAAQPGLAGDPSAKRRCVEVALHLVPACRVLRPVLLRCLRRLFVPLPVRLHFPFFRCLLYRRCCHPLSTRPPQRAGCVPSRVYFRPMQKRASPCVSFAPLGQGLSLARHSVPLLRCALRRHQTALPSTLYFLRL